MKNKVLEEFKLWIKEQPVHISMVWTKRAAAYIRVSTDRQTELSPISQLKEIYKYAIHNELYLDLDYIFIEEEGISAKESKIEKRTEFNRMIALSKSKDKLFDEIIVWKFSRFARSQEQSILFKNLLRKEYNIDVKSVSEPIIDGPFGGLIERIIEWFDEYYLINLSQEVTRGMTEGAHEGKYQSVAPFGYRWDNHKLIIKNDEAEIVKLIYNKFINEEMTMLELARYINNLGFRTKRGGKFENRTINYIILNPVYKGYARWTPNGKLKREELYNNNRSIITKGNFESIIDEKTWDLAVKKLETFRSFRKPHQIDSKNPWSWIKGLVRCKNCGKTLIRTSGKLRCNGYNKGACSCGDSLDIEEVKTLVLGQIKQYYDNPINIQIETKIKNIEDTNEKEILIKKLDFIKTKQERIKSAYINGIDTLEEYKNNKKALLEEENTLSKQLSKINTKKKDNSKLIIKEHLQNAYTVLTDESIDMSKKYTIAHELINKVEYEKGRLFLIFNKVK